MSCPIEKIWDYGRRKYIWQPTIHGLGKPQKPLTLQAYNRDARAIHTVSYSKKEAYHLLDFLKIVLSTSWAGDLPPKKRWNHKGRK